MTAPPAAVPLEAAPARSLIGRVVDAVLRREPQAPAPLHAAPIAAAATQPARTIARDARDPWTDGAQPAPAAATSPSPPGPAPAGPAPAGSAQPVTGPAAVPAAAAPGGAAGGPDVTPPPPAGPVPAPYPNEAEASEPAGAAEGPASGGEPPVPAGPESSAPAPAPVPLELVEPTASESTDPGQGPETSAPSTPAPVTDEWWSEPSPSPAATPPAGGGDTAAEGGAAATPPEPTSAMPSPASGGGAEEKEAGAGSNKVARAVMRPFRALEPLGGTGEVEGRCGPPGLPAGGVAGRDPGSWAAPGSRAAGRAAHGLRLRAATPCCPDSRSTAWRNPRGGERRARAVAGRRTERAAVGPLHGREAR